MGRIEIDDRGRDLFWRRRERAAVKPSSRFRISRSWMVCRLASTQTRNDGSRSSIPSSSRPSS
jgi:hypothetical protein